MNLFETLVIVILCLYLVKELYFSITGRIINRKDRKEDVERIKKSMEWEDQLKVLTKRLGEITTENTRITDENRKWQYVYNELLTKYRELQKKNGDVQDDEVKSE